MILNILIKNVCFPKKNKKNISLQLIKGMLSHKLIFLMLTITIYLEYLYKIPQLLIFFVNIFEIINIK
jgi:hypothetical protein